MSKSNTKKIERLESIIIGAGFLLRKLQATYGEDFGVGLDDQVRKCILDCHRVAAHAAQRKAAATPAPEGQG